MREAGRGLWTTLQGLKADTDEDCRVSTALWKSRGALGVATGRREGLDDGERPARWWLSCGKDVEVHWIYFIFINIFYYLFLSWDS